MVNNEKDVFKSFEIISIDPVGVGTRVCIDFIDVLSSKEGLLVGNTGHGFIKVMAETRQTETYPAREFRVNIGAVNQYIYLGDNKTCYLSEIKVGMQIPVYDNLTFRYVTVGRVKMEKREFVRIVCRNGDNDITGIFQDSESVFLQNSEDSFKSMKEIKIGTKVLGIENEPGRHLGIKIDEEIVEK